MPVAEILFQLFILLLATKIGDELFKRIGQPPLVGEILAGVVVGPALLGWYQINDQTELFAQIGAVLLLFQVGVHTRVGDIVRVGGVALAGRPPGRGPPVRGWVRGGHRPRPAARGPHVPGVRRSRRPRWESPRGRSITSARWARPRAG